MTSGWQEQKDRGDRNSVDHLLTCPRCGDLCPGDCRYCAECGSRLLPTDCYPPVEISELLDAPYPDELVSEADGPGSLPSGSLDRRKRPDPAARPAGHLDRGQP